MLEGIIADAGRFGAELDGLVRVDRSVSRGVVNTVIERDSSLVLLGWKGSATAKDRVLGSLLSDIAESLPCVVAACWLPTGPPVRLVLAIGHEAALDSDVTAALDFCRRLVKGSGLPIVVASAGGRDDPDVLAWPRLDGAESHDLATTASPGDLVILPAPRGRELVGAAARHLAAQRPGLNLVVVQAGTSTAGTEVGEVFARP